VLNLGYGRVVAGCEAPSRLGLGCVTLGNKGRAGVRLVHQALDLGVGVFDTSDAYGAGSSERVLGRALRGRREEAIVATKAGYLFRERHATESFARRLARPVLSTVRSARRPGRSASGAGIPSAYTAQDFSPTYLRSALEGSLRRLGTDHIDIYQLHAPGAVAEDEVLALMHDFVLEGKIRRFGVGLESLGNALAWLATGALSSIQIPFGVLDPDAGDAVIPQAVKGGVPVIVRGVFAGGHVARPSDQRASGLRSGQAERLVAVAGLASALGVDPMQVAAWFVMAHEGVSTVLVGASSSDHLRDGVQYMTTPLPPGLIPRLEALCALGHRASP
jgi:aryl-alcohol dehydrogenase-like predicted oxidoreductase